MNTTSKNHYIAGKWIMGQGEQFSSESPSTERVIWTGYNATHQNVNDAISAASDAFPLWAKLDLSKRIEYLNIFVDLLKENKVELKKRDQEEVILLNREELLKKLT